MPRRPLRKTTLVLYEKATPVTSSAPQTMTSPPRNLASCETGGTSHVVRDKQVLQMYKGQLQVKIYEHDGILTVHVQEARDVYSRNGDVLRTFVKVSLLPNTKTTSVSYKSKVFNGHTIHHYYNDKFTLETSELPSNARLVLSVWNIGTSSDSYELLGCMSFGIDNIKQRHRRIEGWYFLLSDKIGAKKHLKVISKCSGNNFKKNIYFLDKYTFTIPNSNNSFGFRIFNVFDEIKNSMCQTCRIKNISTDSPSYRSGLRDGDILTSVNGIRVSSLFVDVIANIIRNCGKELRLEVNRKSAIDSLLRSPGVSRRTTLNATELKVHDPHPPQTTTTPLSNVSLDNLSRSKYYRLSHSDLFQHCVEQTMHCVLSRD